MLVVVALVGLAVLGAVVVVAMGRGGELSEVHPDHPPLALPSGRPIAGTDAALLQLPRGLWGYHVDITDEALRRLAYALTERDARVAVLEQRLAELSRQQRAEQSGHAGHPMWDDTAATPWEPPDDAPNDAPNGAPDLAPDDAPDPGRLDDEDYTGRHAGPIMDPEDHPGEEVR